MFPAQQHSAQPHHPNMHTFGALLHSFPAWQQHASAVWQRPQPSDGGPSYRRSRVPPAAAAPSAAAAAAAALVGAAQKTPAPPGLRLLQSAQQWSCRHHHCRRCCRAYRCHRCHRRQDCAGDLTWPQESQGPEAPCCLHAGCSAAELLPGRRCQLPSLCARAACVPAKSGPPAASRPWAASHRSGAPAAARHFAGPLCCHPGGGCCRHQPPMCSRWSPAAARPLRACKQLPVPQGLRQGHRNLAATSPPAGRPWQLDSRSLPADAAAAGPCPDWPRPLQGCQTRRRRPQRSCLQQLGRSPWALPPMVRPLPQPLALPPRLATAQAVAAASNPAAPPPALQRLQQLPTSAPTHAQHGVRP